MKFFILDRNVPWNSNYQNFPSFFGIKEYKYAPKAIKDRWLLNNFTSFKYAGLEKLTENQYYEVNRLSNSGVLTTNFENFTYIGDRELISNYNYAILVDDQNVIVQYFFITNITWLNNSEIEINYSEDFLFKNFEKVYNSLPTSSQFVRAHVDRFNSDKKEAFRWDETSELLNRDPILKDYNPTLNSNYPLTAVNQKLNGEPAVLIFARPKIIDNQSGDGSYQLNETHIVNSKQADGFKLPFIVFVLPVTADHQNKDYVTIQNYLEVINDDLFYLKNADYQGSAKTYIISTQIIPLLPFDLNDSSLSKVELQGEVYGYKGDNNEPIRRAAPKKYIKVITNLEAFQNIELKVGDKENSQNHEFNFINEFYPEASENGKIQDPKLSQFPLTQINIESLTGSKYSFLPELLLNSKTQAPRFYLNINVNPYGITNYFSLDQSLYKDSKLIGDLYRYNTSFVLPYVDSSKNIIMQEKNTQKPSGLIGRSKYRKELNKQIAADAEATRSDFTSLSDYRSFTNNLLLAETSDDNVEKGGIDPYDWLAIRAASLAATTLSYLSSVVDSMNAAYDTARRNGPIKQVKDDAKVVKDWWKNLWAPKSNQKIRWEKIPGTNGSKKIDPPKKDGFAKKTKNKWSLKSNSKTALLGKGIGVGLGGLSIGFAIADVSNPDTPTWKKTTQIITAAVTTFLEIFPIPFGKLASAFINLLSVIGSAIFAWKSANKFSRPLVKTKHRNVDAGTNFINAYNTKNLMQNAKSLDGFKFKLNVAKAPKHDLVAYEKLVIKNGYHLNGEVSKNQAFYGRDTFNYIQANFGAYNLKLKLKAEETIKDTFSQGIRLWHQKDLNQLVWNDYETDNQETWSDSLGSYPIGGDK